LSLPHAGFKWVVTPGYESAVTSFQAWSHESLESDPACRVLKKEVKRFAGTLTLGGRTFFVKSQTHARRGFGIPSLFRPSPGRREWDHSSYAHSHGIPTASPIAFGERRQLFGVSQSIFLSELVENDGTLAACVEAWLRDSPGRVLPMIEAAGALLRRLHEIGMLCWDYHPDNLLIRRGTDFTLIDLKSAEIRPGASRETRLENVAKSLFQLTRYKVFAHWRPAGPEAYLRGYFGETVPRDELKVQLIRRGRMLFEHLREDFLGSDSRFGVVREGGMVLHSWKDAARDLSIDLLPPNLRTPREFLWAADGPEGRVVPSTRPGRNLLLRSVEPRPAKEFWLHALRCLALGLPVVPLLAMVEEDGTAKAICQVLDAPLQPAAGPGEAVRRLVEALHALDFSVGSVEPRHLRLRPPGGANEEPVLLLLYPEAVTDRTNDAGPRAEIERLSRLLPG